MRPKGRTPPLFLFERAELKSCPEMDPHPSSEPRTRRGRHSALDAASHGVAMMPLPFTNARYLMPSWSPPKHRSVPVPESIRVHAALAYGMGLPASRHVSSAGALPHTRRRSGSSRKRRSRGGPTRSNGARRQAPRGLRRRTLRRPRRSSRPTRPKRPTRPRPRRPSRPATAAGKPAARAPSTGRRGARVPRFACDARVRGQRRSKVRRLTKRPSPLRPMYVPFSTTTLPRDRTCVGAPTTSLPS